MLTNDIPSGTLYYTGTRYVSAPGLGAGAGGYYENTAIIACIQSYNVYT